MRTYAKEKLPPVMAKKSAATITPGAAKKKGDRSEVRTILQEDAVLKKPVPKSAGVETGVEKEAVLQVERKKKSDGPEV